MSTTDQKTIVRCEYFRAKSPYGGVNGSEDVMHELDVANLVSCWCVRTQGPAAPDNGFVDPDQCVSGRSCYVAPDE